MNNLYFLSDPNDIATPYGTMLFLLPGVRSDEQMRQDILDYARRKYEEYNALITLSYNPCEFDEEEMLIWKVADDDGSYFQMI